MNKWIFISIGLLLTSCIKDIHDTIDRISKTSEVEWTPEIALPLINSEMGIEHLVQLKGDLVEHRVESDGSITLVYESKLFSLRADEVFILPDQNYTENIILNAAQLALLNAGSVDIQIIKDFDFSFSANQLDSMLLKSGNLLVDLQTSLQHTVSATVSILGSNQNGQPVSSSLLADYNGSIPVTASDLKSLDNAGIDMTQGSQGHSQFRLAFDIHIEKKGTNPIAITEFVNVGLHFSNAQFRYLKGYLSSTNLSNGKDSLLISIFKNNEGGSFTLADPRVRFRINNSFGASVQANLTQFDGINQNGNLLSLTGYPNPFILNKALYRGDVFKDSVVLNSGNSNLASYINNNPYTNIYEYSIFTNPQSPTERIWVLDSSKVECDVVAEVPLYGTAKNYKFELKSELNLDQEIDEYIEEIMFRLHTENEFPIDGKMQVYFEDTVSNTIIDSFFVDDLLILPSSTVDANGKTISTTPKTVDKTYASSQLQALKLANRARIVFYLNTLFENGVQPDVRIYEEYGVLVKFGIQAKLSIDEKL